MTDTAHMDYLEEHLRTLMTEKKWHTKQLKVVEENIRHVEKALHQLNHQYLPPED